MKAIDAFRSFDSLSREGPVRRRSIANYTYERVGSTRVLCAPGISKLRFDDVSVASAIRRMLPLRLTEDPEERQRAILIGLAALLTSNLRPNLLVIPIEGTLAETYRRMLPLRGPLTSFSAVEFAPASGIKFPFQAAEVAQAVVAIAGESPSIELIDRLKSIGKNGLFIGIDGGRHFVGEAELFNEFVSFRFCGQDALVGAWKANTE